MTIILHMTSPAGQTAYKGVPGTAAVRGQSLIEQHFILGLKTLPDKKPRRTSEEGHTGYIYKVMAFRRCLILFFLVMTVNVCSAHWMGNRDRRMPPPVESFLEKLKVLSNQRLKRDVRGRETDMSTQEVTKEDAQTGQNALSSLLHLREKRYAASTSARGCHLGTCQIQNLANMLYRLGNNNSKMGSNRDTKDPLGYGRRRRSLLREKERTGLSETLLAT